MNLSISPGMPPSAARGVAKLTTSCFLALARLPLPGSSASPSPASEVMTVVSGVSAAMVRSWVHQSSRVFWNASTALIRSSSSFFSASSFTWSWSLSQAKAEASARRPRYLVSTSASAPLRNRETPPIQAAWRTSSAQGKMSRTGTAGLNPRARSCPPASVRGLFRATPMAPPRPSSWSGPARRTRRAPVRRRNDSGSMVSFRSGRPWTNTPSIGTPCGHAAPASRAWNRRPGSMPTRRRGQGRRRARIAAGAGDLHADRLLPAEEESEAQPRAARGRGPDRRRPKQAHGRRLDHGDRVPSWPSTSAKPPVTSTWDSGEAGQATARGHRS